MHRRAARARGLAALSPRAPARPVQASRRPNRFLISETDFRGSTDNLLSERPCNATAASAASAG